MGTQNPDDRKVAELEVLLLQLDDQRGLLPGAGQPPPLLPADIQELTAALAAEKLTGEHLELSQLRELALRRQLQAADWELPEHLRRCRVCLEAFQAVTEGLPAPSAEFINRLTDLGSPKVVVVTRSLFLSTTWARSARVAALLAVVFGAAFLGTHYWFARAIQVEHGRLVRADGKVLRPGAGIPQSVVLHAEEPSVARFRDGTTLDLSAQSNISFHRAPDGATTLRLIQGGCDAEVAKQPPSRQFIVQTPLGQVVVVGTAFSITCQQGSDPWRREVEAVRVRVREGVVRVRNEYGDTDVRPGQAAVLRRDNTEIELHGDARVVADLSSATAVAK